MPCFTTGLQLDVVAMLHARARAAAPPPAASPRRESSRGPRTATPCGLLQERCPQPRSLGTSWMAMARRHMDNLASLRSESHLGGRPRRAAAASSPSPEPGAPRPSPHQSLGGAALRSEEGVGDGEVEARGMRRRELWWP